MIPTNVTQLDQSSFRALYFSMIPTEHKEPSLFKMVVVGPEERVVGVHVIGMGSDELLQGFAVAVKMGGEQSHIQIITFGVRSVLMMVWLYAATKREFDDTVAIHPTSAEGMCAVLRRAALTISPHNCVLELVTLK